MSGMTKDQLHRHLASIAKERMTLGEKLQSYVFAVDALLRADTKLIAAKKFLDALGIQPVGARSPARQAAHDGYQRAKDDYQTAMSLLVECHRVNKDIE